MSRKLNLKIHFPECSMQRLKKIFTICISIILASAVLICALYPLIRISAKDPPSFEPPDVTQKRYPTVIIDAGHGGEDGGAVGVNGILEKDLNLSIALALYEMLCSRGIPARLTRTDDTLLYDRDTNYQGHKKALDMVARLAISEEYESAIFVSIHMNSFTQSKYSGLQVYYSENDARSHALAELIQSLAVTNLQPENNRKTKPSDGNIYLLDKISHPAVLVECGFLSNNEECTLLCTSEYQNRLVLTLFSSILKYFEACANIS